MFEGKSPEQLKRLAITQRLLIGVLYGDRIKNYVYDRLFARQNNDELVSTGFGLVPIDLSSEEPIGYASKLESLKSELASAKKKQIEMLTGTSVDDILDIFIGKSFPHEWRTEYDLTRGDILALMPHRSSGDGVGLGRAYPDTSLFCYKRQSCIWISPDDDVFTVEKPYSYTTKEPIWATAHYNFAIGTARGDKEPGVLVWKIRKNVPNQSATRTHGYEFDIFINRDSAIQINKVSIDRMGFVVVEGDLIPPVDRGFREDVSFGGRPETAEYGENLALIGGGLSRTFTTQKATALLALVIMGFASLCPR